MIFSLGRSEKYLSLPSLSGTDIYCFFHIQHSVQADESLWWRMITASLRGKRNVLILEREIEDFPRFNEKARWETGDNWSWLTPRCLSVISKAYEAQPMSFQDFKTYLTNSK